jgi:opacity protein-like surface antigen
MNKFVVGAFCLVVLTNLTFAQDAPKVKAGSMSFNFTLNGLATFGLNGTGPGAGLGGSYFLEGNSAARAGVQIGFSSTNIPYTGTGAGADGDSTNSTIGFSIDYLRFFTSSSSTRVRPFVGAGLTILSHSNYYKTSVASGTHAEETTNGNGYTKFGFNGILGVEFFLYNEMSVSAEYDLNLFNYQKRKDTEYSSGTTTTTTKNGSTTNVLGFGAAGATLHIYF